MIKKITLIIFFIISICFASISTANILIIAIVDDEIITNYDLKKESDYLKILNRNLEKLDNNQILQLAKNSLINEIIKKKRLKNF